MRTAQLGTTQIHLQGKLPLTGDRLVADFAIPPARLAAGPLLASDLRMGFVVVSTLPNIEKHACLAQIVELEERTYQWVPELRIVHVSADQESHWREVDRFHPNILPAGYSLCCADPVSRNAFVEAFGIGVEGHQRIAHGLFGLRDGVFLAADIPDDQMKPADVRGFLTRVAALAGQKERSSTVQEQ